jgi:DnaK suppressor protein
MPMSTSELNRYRTMLSRKKAELEVGLGTRAEIEIHREPEPMDDLVLATERDLAAHNLERETELLAEVEAALERIEEGHYGLCLDCGEEINPKRLATVPWASYCVRCQTLRDGRRGSVRRESAPDVLHRAA